MFNNVPIPMHNVLESEFKTMTGCLQSRCVVGETDRGVDDIFLAESMDNICQFLYSRRIEQAVGVGIDRGIQPMSLIIELDHGFIDRSNSG